MNLLIRVPFPKLALLQPAPLRRRLWQGAVALLVLLLTFTVGNFVVAPDKSVSSRMLGHDFLAFYTAGTVAREGRFDQLYNLDHSREFQHEVARQANLEIGPNFGPYWNPPLYAWLPASVAGMPYRQALATWTGIHLACLVIAVVLLVKLIQNPHPNPLPEYQERGQEEYRARENDWRNWLLIPILILTSMPFVQAISHAQNTFMSLMLLSLVVTAWRMQKPILAGLLCGLLFYKPQLAAVVAIMLMLSMGIRVGFGLGFVGSIVLFLTNLTMPGAIGDYLEQLPLNLKYMQVDHAYLWERHATLKAFWRLLFQGRGPGEASGLVSLLTITSCALIGFGLLGAWWRSRKTSSRDRLISATIISMPLLMPFYFDYDLLLLTIPAVLFAGEILNRQTGLRLNRIERLFVGTWIGLYAWLMVNPPLASASGVNVTVLLLSTIAGLSIVRACQADSADSSLILPLASDLDVKRAA